MIVVTVSRLQHALTALDAQPSRDLYCNDRGLESDSRQADVLGIYALIYYVRAASMSAIGSCGSELAWWLMGLTSKSIISIATAERMQPNSVAKNWRAEAMAMAGERAS